MPRPITSAPRKRSGYKRPTHKRRRSPRKSRRSTSHSSDEDFSPPPSEDEVLRNVNSGIAVPDDEDSLSHESTHSTYKVLDPEICDDGSDESDVTWTPSINDDNSDEDLDLEDRASIWQEIPIRYSDITISFNKVDTDLEYGYKEEVKEIKKRVLREYNNLSSRAVKKAASLNATKL